MWILFSKLVQLFLRPLIWSVVLFLASWFLNSKRWSRKCFISGLLVLFVFSNPFLFNIVMKSWEGSPIAVEDIQEEYDYIILLGGFTAQKDEKPGAYWVSERGSRLTSALELLQKGKGKQLIISGGTGSIWNTDRLPEAQYNRNYLVEIGIADSLIIMENKSVNTYENALYTKEILDKINPDSKCLLVTSAFHMKRSMGLFEKMGMDVTPFPTDYLHSELNRPNNIIIPSPKALHGWEILLKEWVGIFTYWIKGEI